MSRRAPVPIAIAMLASAAAGAAAYHLMAGAPDLDEDDVVAAARPQPGAGALEVSPAQQAAAGLRLVRLAPAPLASGAGGYARALDLAPLSAMAAEVAAARAALTASQREEARLGALVREDAGASQREWEAARAQAATDRVKLTQACRRVALEYGPGLGRLGCDALDGLVTAAVAGDLAVLRIDLPATALPTGAAVDLALAPGTARVTVLGPASAGDTGLQTAGVIALLRGPAARRAGVGRVLQARAATGPARAGVLIPREAVVRVDGDLFAWRPSGSTRFVRVPLTGAVAGAEGWIVPAGAWQPGQAVVANGAGTLLGLEHAAPAEDD